METNDKDLNKRPEPITNTDLNNNPNLDDTVNDMHDSDFEIDTRYDTDGMGGPGGTLKAGNLGAGDMLMPTYSIEPISRPLLPEDEINPDSEETNR